MDRSAAALATFVARDVVVRLRGRRTLWRHAFGSCSGRILAAVEDPLVFDFTAEEDDLAGARRRQRGAQRAARRRLAARQVARRAARQWEVDVRTTGAEADDRGRWAIAAIVRVQRPPRRRGLQLDVLVRWAGEDAEETWEPLSRQRFTPDQYKLAREMEAATYGARVAVQVAARSVGARRTPRLAEAAARREAARASAAAAGGRDLRQRGPAAQACSIDETSSSSEGGGGSSSGSDD